MTFSYILITYLLWVRCHQSSYWTRDGLSKHQAVRLPRKFPTVSLLPSTQSTDTIRQHWPPKTNLLSMNLDRVLWAGDKNQHSFTWHCMYLVPVHIHMSILDQSQNTARARGTFMSKVKCNISAFCHFLILSPSLQEKRAWYTLHMLHCPKNLGWLDTTTLLL